MSSNNSKSQYNHQEIKERILFLDVRPQDLYGCSSLDQEFTVILRKTGDLKAFCDPSETGFAGRIREINKAHRTLKQVYQEREINSFSEFFKEDNEDSSSSDSHNGPMDG